VDGATAPYRAREAEGAEREELWRKALAFYAGYAAYERRAGGRRIPIMVLETAPSERPAD
jgi:F420H(2)-dependent quinone reductase